MRLTDACGIEIWTNTGLYAARNHEYLPPYAKEETAEQLSRRWVEEARKGVDGVKPRFIKIGVNRGPLAHLDKKIVRAAALCSRETGLTIVSHTGNGVAATEQLDIVLNEKGSPAKFVWVHADAEKDHAFHRKIAEACGRVDHIGPTQPILTGTSMRTAMRNNPLGRTLISPYYKPGEPNGGSFKDYTHL
jgi:phosphotriesterase-related protein